MLYNTNYKNLFTSLKQIRNTITIANSRLLMSLYQAAVAAVARDSRDNGFLPPRGVQREYPR
jgi:hypothetical protein